MCSKNLCPKHVIGQKHQKKNVSQIWHFFLLYFVFNVSFCCTIVISMMMKLLLYQINTHQHLMLLFVALSSFPWWWNFCFIKLVHINNSQTSKQQTTSMFNPKYSNLKHGPMFCISSNYIEMFASLMHLMGFVKIMPTNVWKVETPRLISAMRINDEDLGLLSLIVF